MATPTYQELQLEAKSFVFQERQIQALSSKINDYGGRDNARKQQLQAEYDRQIQDYQGRRAEFEQRTGYSVDEIKSLAPKRYRTDLLNRNKYTDAQGNYVPPNAVSKTQGVTGVKYSQPSSLTGGGVTTASGTAPVRYAQSDAGVVGALSRPGGPLSPTEFSAPKESGANFTPAYGYSTNTGSVAFLISPAAPTKTPSFQEQRQSDIKAFNEALNKPGVDNKALGETFLKPFITVPGGIIERGSQRAKAYFESQTPPEDSRAALGQKVFVTSFRFTEGLGRQARTQPDAFVVQTAADTATGYGLGKGGGWLVKKLAQQDIITAGKFSFSGTTAARYTEGGLTALGVGTLGAVAYTSTPEELGARAPGFVGGGIGFIRGYRSVVPAPSITLDPRGGSVSRVSFSDDAVSGTGTLRYVANVQQYGVTRKVPVESGVLFQGQRVPNTNYFGVRVEAQTAVPFNNRVAYQPSDFVGVYNANTGVLALRDQGTFYFSQSGKSSPAMFDTVSSFERVPARFIVLETNKAGIPSVQRTGRVSTVFEAAPVTRVPYRGVSGVNVFGQPNTLTVSESNAFLRSQPSSAADTGLFRGGFQNLQRAGMYRDPRVVQREPFMETLDRSFFDPEVKRLYAGAPILEKPRVTVSGGRAQTVLEPTSVLRQPKPFELSGLPVRAPPIRSTVPVVALSPSFVAAQATDSIMSFRSSQTPKQPTKPFQDTSPSFDTSSASKPRQEFFPDQNFKFESSQVFDSPVPFAPPTTLSSTPPPATPPVTGFGRLPLFGRGSSGESRGRSTPRGFRYAPNLASVQLGITGRVDRKVLSAKTPLTGFELRPIPLSRKRGKKK